MALDPFELFLAKFDRNPPAILESIRAQEAILGIELPPDYLKFLMLSNGGDGWIGKSYLSVCPVEELRDFNDSNEVQTYTPGAMFFASDGGGEAFAFDTRAKPMPILMIPFDASGWKDALIVGGNLVEFLDYLMNRW